MSKYTIKSYQESFLEAQEKVGTEATKEWRAFGQTPAAMLKTLYSRPGFDPETKHYAFEGDKLVGFITSGITEEDPKKANLELPIVLQEHEECSEMLFNKAVDSLKQKGVTKVQTRIGDAWPGTKEKAEKWGYSYSKELYMLLEAKIDEISVTATSESKIENYDHSRDSEQMINLWVERFNQEKEYATNNFQRIAENKEDFPVHLVIRKENQIVGRAMASRDSRNPKVFNLGTFVYENEKEMQSLFAEVISRLNKIGAERITFFLYGETLSLEEKYLSFGFKKEAQIDHYEKEI